MNASTFLFWPVVAMVIAGGLGAVLARNLVYAALSLGGCLAGIASLYLFLQAEYVAVIQMIVYVGGILILILFGVMFSRDILGERSALPWAGRILGGAAGASVLAVVARLAWLISNRPIAGLSSLRSAPAQWEGQIGSNVSHHLGDLLLDQWLVPFLAMAILLTVVLVAGLGLVRKDAT